MTGDGFRDKFDPAKRLSELRKGTESADPVTPSEYTGGEGTEDAFSILSADRQQKLMVEFRFKDGNAKALAYSFLVSADLNPSQGIRLDFSGYVVEIAGRNLDALFAGLVSQRAAVVRETDELHAKLSSPDNATVITSIAVAERE